MKAFNKVAAENDEIMFGICTDEAVKKEYKMEKDGMLPFCSFKYSYNTEQRHEAFPFVCLPDCENFITDYIIIGSCVGSMG